MNAMNFHDFFYRKYGKTAYKFQFSKWNTYQPSFHIFPVKKTSRNYIVFIQWMSKERVIGQNVVASSPHISHVSQMSHFPDLYNWKFNFSSCGLSPCGEGDPHTASYLYLTRVVSAVLTFILISVKMTKVSSPYDQTCSSMMKSILIPVVLTHTGGSIGGLILNW